ncbi:MAG: hypothetical protein JWO94_2098 [Verrucomicrobiaceae bacterium]|nr:hypothetical protein [Verrucomicrobiaceae bacterium]
MPALYDRSTIMPCLRALLFVGLIAAALAPGALTQAVLPAAFVPTITFSETSTDRVVKNTDAQDPSQVSYYRASSVTATATIVANIEGTVLADINGDTPVEIIIGGFLTSFTLGQIRTYSVGQTSAFYCWNGWDAQNKPQGTGGVKLTWTASKLTAVITIGNEASPQDFIGTAFEDLGDTPGTFAIKDKFVSSVLFGNVSAVVPNPLYVSGTCKVTHAADYPVYDYSLYTFNVSGAGDYVRPTIALTSPKQGASVGGAVDVKGTAADAKGLTGVDWTLDPAGSWTATDQFSLTSYPQDGLWGATAAIWTVSQESLPYGTTKLYVRSYDEAGNYSLPLLVSLVNPMPLVLTGRWDALLAPAGPDGLRGALHFSFTAGGGFTGSLVQEGGTFAVTGTLLPDGTVHTTIKRSTLLPTLDFDGLIASFAAADSAAASFTGTLKNGGSVLATFSATRSPWSAASPAPANLAGRLNVHVAPAAAPLGESYAVVNTARAGTSSAAFAMADGSVVTWSGVMGAGGQLPAFGLLYGGKGSVSSPMVVNGAARTIDATTVTWVRPAAFTDKQFPLGFHYDALAASGSAYVLNGRVMGLAATSPNATATWSGDAIGTAQSQSFTVNATNTLSIPATLAANPSTLKLALTASTGLWTGSFKLPGTTALSACKLLIVGNEAYGQWTAPAPAGSPLKRYGVIHVQ